MEGPDIFVASEDVEKGKPAYVFPPISAQFPPFIFFCSKDPTLISLELSDAVLTQHAASW